MSKIGVIKKIDKLGRVVIPKELRDRYGLDKGIEIVATGEGVLIRSPKYFLTEIPTIKDDTTKNR